MEMADSETKNDKSPVETSGQVKKEEMVEYLMSTGRIRKALAGSVYDQGLDNWTSLIEGDEDHFMGFKGVGKKTTEAFLELASVKKEMMEQGKDAPDIRDILGSVPRMTQPVIDNILESGYADLSKFKDIAKEELMECKGVGPKLSESILVATSEAIEKFGLPEVIEDATAEIHAEGEEQEESGEEKAPTPGIFDKIISGIRSFFGGKKEEKKEETSEKEEPKDETTEEKPAEKEEPAEDTEKEEPKDETTDEEPPEDIEKEGPEEEEAPEEEPAEEESSGEEEKAEEETSGKEGSEDGTPEEEDEDKEPEEEPAEKKEKKPSPGIFDRILGFFKGSKKEENTEEEPAEKEEKEPAEEEGSEEDGTPEDMEGDEVEETSEEGKEDEPSEEKESEKEDETPEVIEAKPVITEIEDVPGISKGNASKLRDAGYMNVDELKEAVPEDLLMIEGFGEKTAGKICDAVGDL
ncbi:MAG: helix-hairpin-helix domain-containing protein [Candidatus Thermoplasmatota archaeon]|nr:helix-hairpin-helix domain-containing protein [Candidatus Thermoplasmatota archaeon]